MVTPTSAAVTTAETPSTGHSGIKFQMTSSAEAASCANAAAGHSASGTTVDVYPMVGTRDAVTVEIVDTGNGLLVIRATDFPQTSPYEVDGGRSPDPTFHAGDLADLHAILDSIRLTALPGSS